MFLIPTPDTAPLNNLRYKTLISVKCRLYSKRWNVRVSVQCVLEFEQCTYSVSRICTNYSVKSK